MSDAVRACRRSQREGFRASGLHRGLTLGQLLERAAAQLGSTEIVFCTTEHQSSAGGRALSERTEAVPLAELHCRGLRLAGALHGQGLVPGDVLAIQLPNRAEAAVMMHAAAALGLILLPIVSIYGPAELDFILRQSGAKALVVPDRWRSIDFTDRIDRLGSLPDLRHIISVGEPFAGSTTTWDQLEHGATASFPAAPGNSEAIAALIYTSGTTSEPKGVLHTHDSLVAELFANPTPPQDRPPAATLQPFPAGHTAGVMSLLGPAVHGCRTVVMDAWDAADAAEAIERYRIRTMAGTPHFLMSLMEHADTRGADLTSIDEVVTGGAGIPSSMLERAHARGWTVLRCYGATEQPSATCNRRDDPIESRMILDGRPIGGARVRLLGPDGHDVAPGQPGEIALTGPEQFAGYSDPEVTGNSFTIDGWFTTGDIGESVNGWLRIVDRKKDIVIRGGENISAREVEDVLLRHAAVLEAAVVPTPDPLYGERVLAFVVLRPGASVDLPELARHFAQAGVARHKTPEALRVIERLPRTAAGKVKKYELPREPR